MDPPPTCLSKASCVVFKQPDIVQHDTYVISIGDRVFLPYKLCGKDLLYQCTLFLSFQDLITFLEANPAAYANILKRRKFEEKENGGIFSMLKVYISPSRTFQYFCQVNQKLNG